MVKMSIWEDSQREIDCHKWIASQRAGRDLGEAAVREWIRRHWWDYLRARWLEHLQGKRYWLELDGGDFGLLRHQFQDKALLLDRIVDRLKERGENLSIINWAIDWHIPSNDVHEILLALNINAKRMSHRFESQTTTT